ncbi:MAG: L,D-transpeptidase family protein [Woeseia sp.]|nr:L,D-transpeptidase family protein [Woeseia sp.]
MLPGCSTLEGFFDNSRATHSTTELQPLAEPLSRNFFVLASPQDSIVGELQLVRINEGDTFSDLAREYGLGYDEIVDANPTVDPWIPAAGTPVLLPTQYVLPDAKRRGIVLNIAAKRLFYYPDAADGEPQTVLTYPIGIGRVGWETPLGSSTVTAKARDPHWYVPISVRKEHAAAGDPLPSVVPPGPDNPLGRHVLKLGMPGYLIHGTNQPYGVGMRVSHGCVRLYPENIESLYELIAIGEPVAIVNQPHSLGRRDDQLFFESHPVLEDHALDTEQHIAALTKSVSDGGLSPLAPRKLEARLLAIADNAYGIPTRLRRGKGDKYFEEALLVRNTVEPDPNAPTLSEVREIMDAMPAEEAATAN